MIEILNTKDFNKFFKQEESKECLLVFSKDNCPHCSIATKHIEALVNNFNDVHVFLIQSDIEKELTLKYNIRVVPTCLILNKEGIVTRTESGQKTLSIYKGMFGSLSTQKVESSLRLLGF